jgi:hypothetical protein
MSLLFGFSYLTPSLKKKTGLPVSATVTRFPSFRLRQPGYPLNLGSVAFRPTIARGLAFSV